MSENDVKTTIRNSDGSIAHFQDAALTSEELEKWIGMNHPSGLYFVPAMFARQLETELIAANAQLDRFKWQDISTAPKETSVLVFMRGGQIAVAELTIGSPSEYWQLTHTDSYAGNGALPDEPVNWMPLPESPK